MNQIDQISQLWSVADLNKAIQSPNQSLSGTNGPYGDPETPVRNLCHLAILGTYMVKSGREDYIDVTVKYYNEILHSENYKAGYYIARQAKLGKDIVNGVIGPAWVVESLCYGYEHFKDIRFLKRALELLKPLSFNGSSCAWTSFQDDQLIDKVDVTLNHQIWCAYAFTYFNSIITTNRLKVELEIPDYFESNLNLFMGYLNKNMSVRSSGRIAHLLKSFENRNTKAKVKIYVKYLLGITKKKSSKYKEDGYHLFNLYALRRIQILSKNSNLDFNFFDSNKWTKIKKYVQKPSFYNSLSNSNYRSDIYIGTLKGSKSPENYNEYGLLYNLSGFEIQTLTELNNSEKTRWYELQWSCIINAHKLSPDPITSCCRVYELALID